MVVSHKSRSCVDEEGNTSLIKRFFKHTEKETLQKRLKPYKRIYFREIISSVLIHPVTPSDCKVCASIYHREFGSPGVKENGEWVYTDKDKVSIAVSNWMKTPMGINRRIDTITRFFPHRRTVCMIGPVRYALERAIRKWEEDGGRIDQFHLVMGTQASWSSHINHLWAQTGCLINAVKTNRDTLYAILSEQADGVWLINHTDHSPYERRVLEVLARKSAAAKRIQTFWRQRFRMVVARALVISREIETKRWRMSPGYRQFLDSMAPYGDGLFQDHETHNDSKMMKKVLAMRKGLQNHGVCIPRIMN